MTDTASSDPASTHVFQETVDLHTARKPLVKGYRTLDLVGEGGMGTVWSAEDENTGQRVAIKVIQSGGLFSREVRKRFSREMVLASKLDHPNIVGVHQAGEERDGNFYVMELVDGLPLHRHIEHYGLSLPEVLRLFAKICRAMQYAHEQHIIHRDLKPSNILVTKDHEPHILDFGMAKALDGGTDGQSLTITGGISGTVAFMSPEQAAGATHDVDHRTDVYAVGINLYRCLMGAFPHDLCGPTVQVIGRVAKGKLRRPSALLPGIDPELERILLKALSMDLGTRYQDMHSLADALEAFAERAPSSIDQGSLARVRKRRLLKATGALIILMTAGAFWQYKENFVMRMGDLALVLEPATVSLSRLAPGSVEAHRQQEHLAETLGLSVEMEARKSQIRFRLIPPGDYLRGTFREDEGWEDNEIQLPVTVPRPFFVSSHEVTQAQWLRVMGSECASEFRGPRLPVERVSWSRALDFTEALCRLEGVPSGTYRLLTENEWEYVCRAGTSRTLFFTCPLNEFVNHCDRECPKPNGTDLQDGYVHSAPVGSFPPNAWGIYDALGNVAEWVLDTYQHTTDRGIIPADEAVDSPLHMMRGGGWSSPEGSCQSGDRNWLQSGGFRNWVGFRVMRTIPEDFTKELVSKFPDRPIRSAEAI